MGSNLEKSGSLDSIHEETNENDSMDGDESITSQATTATKVSHLWQGHPSDDLKVLAKSIMSKPREERGNSDDFKSINNKKDELSLLISLAVHTAFDQQNGQTKLGRLKIAKAAMGTRTSVLLGTMWDPTETDQLIEAAKQMPEMEYDELSMCPSNVQGLFDKKTTVKAK